MADEYRALDERFEIRHCLLNGRRVGDHRVRDPRKTHDKGVYGASGIDERGELVHGLAAHYLDGPDLGDARALRGGGPGCFEIEDHVRRVFRRE